MMISATRYHDISCGHRVVGHEGKCRGLHGHNYRIHFECVGELDNVGRVIDFTEMKEQLCDWLEENWDHKMLLWTEDPVAALKYLEDAELSEALGSVILVPFNPTAENMARYLLEVISARALAHSDIVCRKVIVEETRKCSATAEL